MHAIQHQAQIQTNSQASDQARHQGIQPGHAQTEWLKDLRKRLLATIALTLFAPMVHAGELYVGGGAPGLTVGFAQPVNPLWGWRGEVSSLGNHRKQLNEEGIDYTARLKTERAALLGDWFVTGGGFRLTGGVAYQNYQWTLDGSGAGGSMTVGNTTYITTAADGLLVEVKVPRTVPYIGLGWGHQADRGWRFAFDVGAFIGKATVTVTPRGQLTSPLAQSDINAELAELRDGVGKVKALPQLSFSLGYSF
jgi:hypothetical protein